MGYKNYLFLPSEALRDSKEALRVKSKLIKKLS